MKVVMDEMIMLDNVLPIEIALRREVEYRRKVETSLSLCDSENKIVLSNREQIGVGEEMILLDNLMLAEVALEREAEYRRKVEAFQKQQQMKPSDRVLHLKETLPSLAGTKRKAPSTNSHRLPFFQPWRNHQAFQKLPAHLVCVACKVSYSTLYYLKQHTASLAHRDKLLSLKSNGVFISNPLLCELCNAPCSSEVPLKCHLNGSKHAATLEKLESMRLGREGEAKLQFFDEKHWN